MTLARFSHYFAVLILSILVSGCLPPTQTRSSTPPAAPTPTAFPTAALTPSQTAETQLRVEIDEFMTTLVEQDLFGGSLLVARDGRVLFSKGYGMANWESDAPNTPQTQFRLGSVTKQFTAMAILLLQQQGKLTVLDPICQYIPNCPNTWQSITLHHLLTHTSGIRNFTAASNYAELKKQPATPTQIIDQFRDLPLDFIPGERWRYSNSGIDMSVPYAAGGLSSTVNDLFLWDQALYKGRLIPISLQNEMFTPFVPIPEDRAKVSDTSYGYGWRIGEQFGRRWVAHGGGIDGFAAEFDRYPDDKVAIIVLSNVESAKVGDIALDVARMTFEAK